MIKAQLRNFIESVIDNKIIDADDVRHLHRNVLEDGIATRAEADALLALDRTLDAHESWSDALTRMIVDFVVWGSRPTGYVTADDALWLASALALGSAETASRIVSAILEEAQQVDAALLAATRRHLHAAPQELAA